MTKEHRKYSIIGTNPQEYIQWDVLLPHEPQAMRNHGGQTLKRLAERGGLSWQEVFAVINDKTWTQIQIPSTLEAKKSVLEYVSAWERGLCEKPTS